MDPRYERISRSLVARHPSPVGVVEFYGGQFFGQLPVTSYDYFLGSLFRAGYAIIAVPYRPGFNHAAIAETLLEERDTVRERLPELANVPHFWVGHSLGCKFIALLEALTDVRSGLYLPAGRDRATARRGILDEPSLLLAPDISDTEDVLPIPFLGQILDTLGLGVRPNRAETQRLILESGLFGLTGLISFVRDRTAGNASGSPEESDVAWFIQALSGPLEHTLLHVELAGGHLVPLGLQIHDVVLEVDPAFGAVPAEPPAELEMAAIGMLAELGRRRRISLGQRRKTVTQGRQAAAPAPAAR
jgi:hypothetical protein